MSAAVKAAIAARRKALAQQQQSIGSASPAGSPPASGTASPELSLSASNSAPDLDELALAQAPLSALLNKAAVTGRANLAARHPALAQLPPQLWDLLSADPPAWRSSSTRPWFERPELSVLNASNNELRQCSERIDEFAALARLDLHNNRLPVVPRQLSHLACLTSLHLAGNLLTEFPLPLLALDTLVELDLSSNRIEYLWQAEDVAESRAELTAWRKEQGPNELGGVWAGLDAPASPTKRDRRRTPIDLTRPMAGLKVLRLGNNRLANDALGLDSDAHLPLPLGLTELDLSDNFIRGPLPLHFFARLDSLQVLDIGGNGISSQVFELQSTGGSDVAAPESVFPSLKTLDVHRCDIDDLQPLEAVFGSPRTIAHGEKPHLAGADVSSPLAGVRARQLISAARRRPEETSNGSLYVVLEGNPLREEGFRRKRGGGAARSVSAGVMAAVEKGDPAPNKRADIDANGQTSGAAQSPAPPRRAPAQQAPVNEWAPLGSSSAPPPRKTPQARIAPPRAGPSISQRPAVTATASNDDAFGPLGGAKPNAAAPVNGAAHDAPKFAPSPTKAARATPPAAPEWEAPMSEGQKRRLRAEQARAAEAASSGSTPDAQEHPQPAADAEPATVSAPPQPPVKVAAAAAAAQSPRKRGAAAWESSGALW